MLEKIVRYAIFTVILVAFVWMPIRAASHLHYGFAIFHLVLLVGLVLLILRRIFFDMNIYKVIALQSNKLVIREWMKVYELDIKETHIRINRNILNNQIIISSGSRFLPIVFQSIELGNINFEVLFEKLDSLKLLDESPITN